MGQYGCYSIYYHWACCLTLLRAAPELDEGADVKLGGFQVSDVRGGTASGNDEYVDYYVEHDHSADVPANRCWTVCLYCRAHAIAWQCVEWAAFAIYRPVV